MGDVDAQCTDINECIVYGCAAPTNSTGSTAPGNIDAESCADSTSSAPSSAPNTRLCTCGAGYYAIQSGSPVNTVNLNGSDPFGGCEATCGNSIIDPEEECDGTSDCDSSCKCKATFEPTSPISLYCQEICGNGVLDAGEECDTGLGCDLDCTCATGFEATGSEECQDIDECANYDLTNATCSNDQDPNNQATILCDVGYYAQPPDDPEVVLVGKEPWPGCIDISECTVYGPAVGADHVKSCDDSLVVNERTVTCDDGYYAEPPTTASTTLTGNTNFTGCLSTCGNGILDDGEDCDAVSGTCESTCVCKMGYEPSQVPGQIDCQLVCGNGVLDSAAGEDCDGGSGCGPDCKCLVGTIPDGELYCVDSCGNGQIDAGEECDSTADGSGCTSICTCDGTHESTTPVSLVCQLSCGNGKLDGGEQCDSTAAGSGCVNCLCSPQTQYEPTGKLTCGLICGNGLLDIPEQCDVNGGTNCLAGCVCGPTFEPAGDINCRAICGNGRRDSGEDCDPGAEGKCKADCTCDVGFQPNDDPTKIDCQPVCGNARLDIGEQCDPNGGLYCNMDCTCFLGFEKSALPSTDCTQILGCDVYGDSGKSDHVFSCINGVNTRTITCEVGYYAVAPVSPSVQLTGSEAFQGCFLVDQCAQYGFSGFPANTKNCTGDVSQRTIFCADGYFVLPQKTTSIIL